MLGLICVDVDGTLVGTGNVVREDVWAALADAHAQGVRIALCSGRPAVGHALEYAKRLDPDGWHIFQNGASIVNAKTGESLSEPFPEALLPKMIKHAQATNRLLEIYTDTEYAITVDNAYARQHALLLGVPFVYRTPENLKGTRVRVQWVVPRAEEAEVVAEPHVGLDLHPSGSPVMPEVMFISATRGGVSKGSAIRRIAKEYGVPIERSMMVGDGENDVSALKVVGYPVAMGNADPPALAAANYTVSHVDEGGLKEAVALAMSL